MFIAFTLKMKIRENSYHFPLAIQCFYVEWRKQINRKKTAPSVCVCERCTESTSGKTNAHPALKNLILYACCSYIFNFIIHIVEVGEIWDLRNCVTIKIFGLKTNSRSVTGNQNESVPIGFGNFLSFQIEDFSSIFFPFSFDYQSVPKFPIIYQVVNFDVRQKCSIIRTLKCSCVNNLR